MKIAMRVPEGVMKYSNEMVMKVPERLMIYANESTRGPNEIS